MWLAGCRLGRELGLAARRLPLSTQPGGGANAAPAVPVGACQRQRQTTTMCPMLIRFGQGASNFEVRWLRDTCALGGRTRTPTQIDSPPWLLPWHILQQNRAARPFDKDEAVSVSPTA
eukprot:scaffold65_cov353-Prasinococcus_capsulatus_cf.AAC.16